MLPVKIENETLVKDAEILNSAQVDKMQMNRHNTYFQVVFSNQGFLNVV